MSKDRKGRKIDLRYGERTYYPRQSAQGQKYLRDLMSGTIKEKALDDAGRGIVGRGQLRSLPGRLQGLSISQRQATVVGGGIAAGLQVAAYLEIQKVQAETAAKVMELIIRQKIEETIGPQLSPGQAVWVEYEETKGGKVRIVRVLNSPDVTDDPNRYSNPEKTRWQLVYRPEDSPTGCYMNPGPSRYKRSVTIPSPGGPVSVPIQGLPDQDLTAPRTKEVSDWRNWKEGEPNQLPADRDLDFMDEGPPKNRYA